jgi:hypothetical protein
MHELIQNAQFHSIPTCDTIAASRDALSATSSSSTACAVCKHQGVGVEGVCVCENAHACMLSTMQPGQCSPTESTLLLIMQRAGSGV